MKNYFAGIIVIAGLAGCSTLPAQTSATDAPAAGAYPENYKALILGYAQEAFFDPYSIRSAQVSTPRIGPAWENGTSSGWIVCLRANAKNRMGAYIGLNDTAFMIRNGNVQASITGEVPYYCSEAAYEPFPELEAL